MADRFINYIEKERYKQNKHFVIIDCGVIVRAKLIGKVSIEIFSAHPSGVMKKFPCLVTQISLQLLLF